MMPRFTIVGIGQALFQQAIPDPPQPGGSPLQVAIHAHRLAQARGGQGLLLSRLGQDDAGAAILDYLRQLGINTAFIQTDPDRPTGQAYLEADANGRVHRQVAGYAAWDVLQFDPDWEDVAHTCQGVYFDTLSQRDAQSRSTILRFLDEARRAVRLYDANLGWVQELERSIVVRSCQAATIVKLEEAELPVVASLVGLDAADPQQAIRGMIGRFNLDMLVLHRGGGRVVLHTATQQVESQQGAAESAGAAGVESGVGEAVAAVVLVGRALRLPLERIAELASRAGASLVGQAGPMPMLPDEVVELVRASPPSAGG